MKKLILSFLFLSAVLMGSAQADSLHEYTGKYKFPDGSPVTEIGVIVDNGVLTATASMGNTELRATETKDVFEIVAYGGLATFVRNEEGKIVSLRVQVQDVDMEGTKDGFSSIVYKGIQAVIF